MTSAWACIARIDRLAFKAQPGPASQTGWAGHGQGQATVEVVDEQRLRWKETGQFELAHTSGPGASARPSRALTFNNTDVWERSHNTLRLSHERFGQAHAVFLFSLTAVGPAHLASDQPHLCGADRYSAELVLGNGGFTLDWRIVGPVKDERLFYRYWVSKDRMPGNGS